MRRPSVRFLPREWARVARAIAERLRDAGHRGWIVGGAPRDLALGIEPSDVDMASAAAPEEAEGLFEHTHPVGRAFGTLVVHLEGRDVQLTTFRTEAGYADRRRPDHVAWGRSLEEDAVRRDFTCNALYLDPLDDTFEDPTGGMADLERGLLRCVGEARARFAEDGLRLVRLARFAAGLDLEVDGEAREAARSERTALEGVSPERVAGELRRILTGPRAARAMGLLDDLGLLDVLFPTLGSLPGDRASRARVIASLGSSPGFRAGLAVLFDPAPGGGGGDARARSGAEALLDGLRPSREERRGVLELWRLQAETRAVLAQAKPSRARRVRLVRDPAWPRAADLLRAWSTETGASVDGLEELAAFGGGLGPEELHPEPLLKPADLAELGIERGPRWTELLAEADDLQLDGRLDTRAAALAWLAERGQVGGKTRRSAKDSG